jgi:hypothetical protein
LDFNILYPLLGIKPHARALAQQGKWRKKWVSSKSTLCQGQCEMNMQLFQEFSYNLLIAKFYRSNYLNNIRFFDAHAPRFKSEF